MGDAVKSIIEKYQQELVGSVIPFWENHCVDREHGGFLCCLDRDGDPYDTTKHLWMQWRIVYMFAALAETRFAAGRRERWLEIAKQGFRFLVDHGRDAEGAYYFALNREGEPIVAPYSTGSDFFAILGCTALFKATGAEECREAAIASLQNLLGRAGNPKGRWNKRLAASTKWREHGTCMATVNLGLVLGEELGLPGLDAQVDEAIDAILEPFWSEEHGVILENLGPDLTPDLASPEGRTVCPGHGLESAWFILQHAEQHDRPDRVEKICGIVKSILEQGWDREFGGIYYFTDLLGKPPPELTWDMKLWWVHCEALVALLTGYRLTRDAMLLEWFEKLDEWTWKHFPDPDHGEWFGYLNRRGEPTHMLKGGPWKTFFHLPRALLECIEQMEQL
jgi:N-acylglucosamine 2-epimerase